MPQTTLRPYTRPHPLQDFVSRAMDDRNSNLIDAGALALLLSGALICGEGGAKKNAAYRVVAEDILDLMRAQGVLTEVVHGWYLPATGNPDEARFPDVGPEPSRLGPAGRGLGLGSPGDSSDPRSPGPIERGDAWGGSRNLAGPAGSQLAITVEAGR